MTVKTAMTSFGVLALSLILSSVALAQIKSGTIVGTVTDPSGAAVPGARVSVVNQETNVATTTVTNEAGDFTVPYLSPGTYSVDVEKPGSGFSKYSAKNLTVAVAQTVKIQVGLRIGSTEQTINVSADAIALQTSDATVQGVTNQQAVESLPNITHNAFQYAALQAGVVPRGPFGDTTSTTSFGIGIDGRRQASAIGIGGGAAFSNDIMLDGVSIQGSAWNETAVLPNQESLQEVKTITNDYSAKYGRAQGVVMFTTKSGSNDFHGSAVYRLRNEALNANSFLNTFLHTPRAPFKSDTFGGSLGGPIIRDKAFFFASYEGLRFHKALDYRRIVPTDDERNGDFSHTFSNGNIVPQTINLFNPFGPVTQSGTTFMRTQQLPNDLRATGLLDPFGLALLQAYPHANHLVPGDDFNWFFRGNQQFSRDVVNSRVDYHWGKQYLYLTYGIQKGEIMTPRSWGPDNQYYSPAEFVGNHQTDNNFYTALGDTVVLSPTLVFDARVGVNRIEADNQTDAFPDYNYAQFGIPAAISTLNVIPGVPPQFNPSGRVSGLNNTSSIHKRERQTNTDFNGSMTWTRGRWTHEFGGTYRVLLSNYIDVDNSVTISTSPDLTRQSITANGGAAGSNAPALTGLSIASIALGAGNLALSPGFTLRLALAQKYYALYSQNSWRVNDRLTLNFGLRWDVQPGPTDRFNRLTSIDLNGKEPLFGTPGAIVFPGRGTPNRHLWRTSWANFGPRLGAAYQVTRSLVARAGYGLTYVPSNTGFNDGPGFYGAQPFTSAVNGQPYGVVPNGVPVGRFYSNAVNTIVDPAGANPNNPGVYGGQRRFPYNYKNGYVQQWNFFLEQKLGSKTIVSAGYIGSHGSHLQVAFVPINSPQLIDPNQLTAWRAAYIATGKNPAVAQVCNPFQNLQTCTSQPDGTFSSASGTLLRYGNGNIRNRSIPLLEAKFPYPLEGDNIHLSAGVSDYHALQLSVTRPFAGGLQVSANYTFSKQLAANRYNAQTNQGYGDFGANNGTNNYFPYLRPEQYYLNRQITTNDVPHRLAVNWLYDLPFGSGKRFDAHQPVWNAVIGGWRVAGYFLAQSGFVEPLANGGDNGGVDNVNNPLNNLPDRVPGVALEVPKALEHWYDGNTKVTLPSGRVITPCNGCFLKYDVGAFAARTVTTPTGTVLADNFWYGNAAPSYGDLRSNSIWNVNMSLEKSFRVRERYSLRLAAQATNLFNHVQFRPNINTTFGPTVLTANPAMGLQVGSLLDKKNNTTNTWGSYQLPTNNTGGNNAGGQATYDMRQIELVIQFRF